MLVDIAGWKLIVVDNYSGARSTYSGFIDHLVEDVKFHLRERQVFTGEIPHESEEELGMVHHAVECSDGCRPLVELIHSLIHVLCHCLQVTQL